MFKAIAILCMAFFMFSISFGQGSDSQEKVIFKANTEFSIQLDTAVNSEKNAVGDDVNFLLSEDISGDGKKILKGSVVYGRIVSVEKLSPKNDTAKACIMFDFIKNGEEFISLVATIVSLEPNTEAIKLNPSKTYSEGTTLSLKGGEIKVDKGVVFRIKLTKDITSK